MALSCAAAEEQTGGFFCLFVNLSLGVMQHGAAEIPSEEFVVHCFKHNMMSETRNENECGSILVSILEPH